VSECQIERLAWVIFTYSLIVKSNLDLSVWMAVRNNAKLTGLEGEENDDS